MGCTYWYSCILINFFQIPNDSIFYSQTRKLFNKIYTIVYMTSHQVEKFRHSKICVYCNQIKNELHDFVECNHI